MKQHETIGLEKDPKYEALMLIGLPLLVIGLLADIVLFFMIGLLVYALLFASHYYLTYIHRPLQVSVEWSQVRLFPEEKNRLHIHIHNQGRFGVQGARCQFQLTKKMRIWHIHRTEDHVKDHYELTLHLRKKEGVSYIFDAEGLARGVAQLENVRLQIRDPFGLGYVTKHVWLPKQEILIYPSFHPIEQLEQLHGAPIGETAVERITHEDPTQVMGARPYEQGDPFHRIDWKQTARKQELHTKILDRTAQSELVLLGNVRTYEERWRGVNQEYVERTLSVLASLAQEATIQKSPFHVVLNMKVPGKGQGFHLGKGEGRKHLLHTLESLARVHVLASETMESCLYRAYQNYQPGQVLVLVTAYVSAEMDKILSLMSQDQMPVFVVHTDQENVRLRRWTERVKQYA